MLQLLPTSRALLTLVWRSVNLPLALIPAWVDHLCPNGDVMESHDPEPSSKRSMRSVLIGLVMLLIGRTVEPHSDRATTRAAAAAQANRVLPPIC